MNVKMDKKEAPYKPRVYQNKPRGQSRNRQQNVSPYNRSFSRDRKELEEITIISIETVDLASGIDVGIITGMTTDVIINGLMRDVITIDKTIGGEIAIGRTIEIDTFIEGMTLDKETGVKVGMGLETIVMTVPNVETGIESEMDRCNPDPELCHTLHTRSLCKHQEDLW